MANMSYCRFHNTLQALRDCRTNIVGEKLDQEEREARHALVKECARILNRLELTSALARGPLSDADVTAALDDAEAIWEDG